MNYLYKLVTTQNVEINYDTFRKKELIECLATMRDIYFSLKQENKILKENAENNDKVVDKVNWENQLLKKENKQLKDNWNKLKEDLINDINYWQEQEKEWIKLGFITFGGKANNKIIFKKVLDKMQELEQGSDNNGQCKNN